MTVTESTLDSIESDLVAGIEQHNRRRNRRWMAGAVPIVALVATASFIATDDSDNPTYALAEQPDGTIVIDVFPDFDDVDSLQRDLGEAGLQAVVIHFRAAPSLEGVVEVSSYNNETSGAIEFQGGQFVIDTAAIDGEIEILIYSPTKPGDDFQVSPSVFAPGQVFEGLHCAYPDIPLTAEDFEARAVAAGISNIDWKSFDEVDSNTGSFEVIDYDEQPGGVITGAQMRNADTMEVFIDLDDQAPAATTISMTDGTHYRTVPGCTPDLASRWS
jgi:hypothetical protein